MSDFIPSENDLKLLEHLTKIFILVGHITFNKPEDAESISRLLDRGLIERLTNDFGSTEYWLTDKGRDYIQSRPRRFAITNTWRIEYELYAMGETSPEANARVYTHSGLDKQNPTRDS